MSRFNAEVPYDEIEKFAALGAGTEVMLGDMTKAAADMVYDNVVRNLSKSFKDSDELEKHLKVTKTYKTPSDDSVNTKVGIYGYMKKSNGKIVPAPLVANAREYGSKQGEAKKPFFRKSFKKKEIESIMLEKEKEYIPNDDG